MTETKTVEVTQALKVLERHLSELDVAAIPTKCETFVICGRPAREMHDAIETLVAIGPDRLASQSLSTDEELRRLREALELSVAFIEETHPAQVAIIKRAHEALQSKDTPSHG